MCRESIPVAAARNRGADGCEQPHENRSAFPSTTGVAALGFFTGKLNTRPGLWRRGGAMAGSGYFKIVSKTRDDTYARSTIRHRLGQMGNSQMPHQLAGNRPA